ncbi:MAG: adenine phosphoribosyltransferase [Caldithrix sp.]|nr:adenine phosphoribosyltransferase [Caldithrix sp.]
MKSIEDIKQAIRDVPDFPHKGILFKDITPVLQNAALFGATVHHLCESVRDLRADAIAGIEARGFIFAAAVADRLNCGFVPIRKPGKLPAKVHQESYTLEYGTDSVEMHQDAVAPGSAVVLMDDLLATGGTALASTRLIEKTGVRLIAVRFLIELDFLKGRDKLSAYAMQSLIHF